MHVTCSSENEPFFLDHILSVQAFKGKAILSEIYPFLIECFRTDS